ncbi:hypothetical protein BCR35DRAFT_310104 [Leucosporidium creatinivorum]|uniref:Uncharacterized protein n=1 Tax=Leucosporidium creatinivorum TaxID=106004 RepID=A0A1Y2D7U7_9BASI|nr:hypothetical protein BCR35DRAFT_310104 [Leucosporidium creatinivorum]
MEATSSTLPIPMASAASSTSSLHEDDDEDLTLYHPVASPCSPSILRNPLASQSQSPPIASTSQTPIQRRPSVTAQMVSVVAEPPPHWAAENGWSPPRGSGRYSRSNSASRAEGEGPSSSSTTPETDSLNSRASDDSTNGGKLKFAPLPPGRRQYRSNSLTLGVAARAKMIQGQGAQGNVHQARYAGPQQWYQPGAPHPEDVYTYKDVQRGLGKIWQKMSRRRSSATSDTSVASAGTSTSSSSAEARAMETQGKGKSSEIEHIEEVLEDEEEEDDQGFYEESPPRGRELEREGHSLGLEMGEPRARTGSLDSDTTASTSDGGAVPPMTPEDSRIGLPGSAPNSKGKGVDRGERVSA